MQTCHRCIFHTIIQNCTNSSHVARCFLPAIFYTCLLSPELTQWLFAHTFWLKRVCLSSPDEPDSSDRHPPIILINLLCFCGTLIGWGWGNLPPQTCFLPDPGARSLFLTNYRLPSEMICNSSQWITLPSAVSVTCQYPLSFSDISGGYFGGGGGSGLMDKLRPSQKNLP